MNLHPINGSFDTTNDASCSFEFFDGDISLTYADDPTEMAGWISLMTVRFPEGTTINPRLRNNIWSELGRVCAINVVEKDEVSVVFSASGNAYGQAWSDSKATERRLLSILGLTESSIVEHDMRYITVDDTKQGRVKLSSVPD